MFRIVYTREARFLRRFYKDGTRTLARNAGFNQEDDGVDPPRSIASPCVEASK